MTFGKVPQLLVPGRTDWCTLVPQLLVPEFEDTLVLVPQLLLPMYEDGRAVVSPCKISSIVTICRVVTDVVRVGTTISPRPPALTAPSLLES